MDEHRRIFFDDVFDIFSMLIGSNYVTLYDIKEQITRYSPAIVEMLNLPGEYIEDGVYDWMDYIHPEDRDIYESTMGEMLALRQLTYDLSYRVRLKNGEYHLFRLVGGVIRDADGNPSLAGGMMIHSGLIERIDRVTAMRNLNAFLNDLPDAYDSVQSPDSLILLLLGFGRLAHINEVYGYSYGSRLLKQVSEIIQELTNGAGELYRMEGSKFALVTTHLQQEEVSGLYQQIRTRLQQGIQTDGIVHNLIVYGGIMSVTEDPSGLERAIYDCLLQSYHESKQYWHGDLVIYTGNHVDDPNVSDSVAMINEIRKNLISDYYGFYLLYQPIFKKNSDCPFAAEVLLRWKHDLYGEVLPEAFIPEIEHDLIFRELGYWILRKSMLDGSELLAADPEFTLFVNVFPGQLDDPYFVNNIEEIAKSAGFPLSHLVIKLTKDCRNLSVESLTAFAADLHGKNIRICIDEFARGNRWLKIYTVISPDYICFSKELIEHLADNEKDQIILSHLVKMIDACNTGVLVPYVETEAIRSILAELPVQGMLGSLLAQPLYYDEVLEYYDSEDINHE